MKIYSQHLAVNYGSVTNGEKRFFLKNGPFPATFSFFRLFNTVCSKWMFSINFADDWFEPGTSGVGGDRSTNWATTTAQEKKCLWNRPPGQVVPQFTHQLEHTQKRFVASVLGVSSTQVPFRHFVVVVVVVSAATTFDGLPLPPPPLLLLPLLWR